VASVGVGQDDRWDPNAGDEGQTEDVGLPEHEDDEQRWQPGAGTGGDDPSDVAGLTDVGGAAGDLPDHEDDRRGAEDTGAGEQNP
jgi:hypothetical protein